ncbi:MAG: hypothetical protein JNL01_03790 [Bdellovibrionales bacterium]|nr:hypothetical protein [Bdellovibrionales bacterium]
MKLILTGLLTLLSANAFADVTLVVTQREEPGDYTKLYEMSSLHLKDGRPVFRILTLSGVTVRYQVRRVNDFVKCYQSVEVLERDFFAPWGINEKNSSFCTIAIRNP